MDVYIQGTVHRLGKCTERVVEGGKNLNVVSSLFHRGGRFDHQHLCAAQSKVWVHKADR